MTRNLMKAGYPVNVLTRTRFRVEDLLAGGREEVLPDILLDRRDGL